GEWWPVKRRGLMTELPQYFANNEIIARTGARLRDANLADCSDRHAVKRPKIADQSAAIAGLGLNTLRRSIGPCTFTRARVLLGGSLLRPLERRPDDLAPFRSERAQRSATVRGVGRLWRLCACDPDRTAAQRQGSRNSQPTQLDHVATLPV